MGEGDKGFDADVTLDADRLDVAEILQLWPESVAGDARKWVVANVPVGQVSAAKFQLSSRSTRPGQPEIGGQLGFSGVELRYVDTMLPATGLSGSASLAGNSLEFKVATGRTGEVDLSKGDAVLTNLFVEQPTGLRVAANLSSTVPAAMRLLDAEPVALRKATGLSADNAAGQQTTAFELALPLLDKIPPEKIRFKATTQLTDVELRQAAPGYDLAAQRLAVVAEPAAITAKGDVRVNGVPITVDVRENTPPVRGVQRTVKASGTIDAAGARALAVDWPKEIGGAVGFDATLVEARNPLRTIDVALDLRQTAFSLASAVLVKHAGQAGSASARLVQADAKSLAVQNAVIDVAGWRAEGETDLGLEPLQPRRVLLRQLRGPLGDLTADLAPGRQPVARPGRHRPARRAPAAAGQWQCRRRRGAAARLPGRPDRPAAAARRRAVQRSERYGRAAPAASGPAPGCAPTSRTARSAWMRRHRPSAPSCTLLGSDAGWLIRGDRHVRQRHPRRNLPPVGRREPGRGRIRRERRAEDPATSPCGVRRPMARIISLASFSGLGNALSGQGVPVRPAGGPVPAPRRDGSRSTRRGSSAATSAPGPTATIDFGAGPLHINGTVAPAYTINRILGRIPIIGQILSGSRLGCGPGGHLQRQWRPARSRRSASTRWPPWCPA